MKQLPQILICHFKRFSWTGQKIRNPIEFDEEIQIDAEYICLKEKYQTKKEIAQELNHVYKLYALIVHEGKSTKQGHYYSYIKNTNNDTWYEYNDNLVKMIGPNLNSVKKNTNNAYILFY